MISPHRGRTAPTEGSLGLQAEVEDGDGWYVLIPANTAMSIQGSLLVDDSESLIIGAHVPASLAGRFDPHCSVTWAGKKVK